MLLRYINPHLARGALRSSSSLLMQIEVLMKTTTDHNFVESAIYADIQLGLYGQPVIFSAACLARLRQRAERHLCFNIDVTQASVLRGCTGIFVWNKFHTKPDDRARWTTLWSELRPASPIPPTSDVG